MVRSTEIEDQSVEGEETTVIDLTNKNISKFEPLKLNNLKFLYLENNQLKELPSGLFLDAPNLQWLDVRNNLLEKIPESIENHARIETMLLQNNRISYLPPSISSAKSLKVLQLTGNPIIYPKKAIVNAGFETLINYLRLEYQMVKDNSFDISLKSLDNHERNKELIEFHNSNINDDYERVKVNKTGMKKKKKRTSFLNQEGFQIYNNQSSITLPLKNSNRYLSRILAPTKKEQDLRIHESTMRDLWLEKRREFMNRREKVLQDSRSLDALKNWRKNYSLSQMKNNNTYYTLDLSNLPYDTDLNHVKILTRADIEKDLPDKYKKNIKLQTQKRNNISRDNPSIQSKINDLINNIESMKNETFEWTPRTEKQMITCEIKKLSEIQKKISKLKLENSDFYYIENDSSRDKYSQNDSCSSMKKK